MAGAVPVLAIDAVRAAIADERYDDAETLLGAHLDAVASAIAGGIDRADRNAWQMLLDAQQVLAEECRAGRDAARAALDRAAGDRRGVRAWQQALA